MVVQLPQSSKKFRSLQEGLSQEGEIRMIPCKRRLLLNVYESVGALVVTSSEKKKISASGYSYHMCARNEYFETLDFKEGGVFHLGKKQQSMQALRYGSILLNMYVNREFVLQDVRYVPEIK